MWLCLPRSTRHGRRKWKCEVLFPLTKKRKKRALKRKLLVAASCRVVGWLSSMVEWLGFISTRSAGRVRRLHGRLQTTGHFKFCTMRAFFVMFHVFCFFLCVFSLRSLRAPLPLVCLLAVGARHAHTLHTPPSPISHLPLSTRTQRVKK